MYSLFLDARTSDESSKPSVTADESEQIWMMYVNY